MICGSPEAHGVSFGVVRLNMTFATCSWPIRIEDY